MSKKQCNSSAKNQIKVVLQSIEEMKDKIIEVWADKTLPDNEKTAKLGSMRDALRATENFALSLVSEDVEQEADQTHNASFQWTEPATTEDAFKQVQLLVPMIEEIKSKIAAVELDSSISLKAKATKLVDMKNCLESVQLRVVELSESYLQECAA